MSAEKYFIRWDRNSVVTSGAKSICGFELSVPLVDASERHLIAAMLDHAYNYCKESKRRLKPNETMSLGPWNVKFVEKEGMLHIHELDKTGEKFIPSVQFLLGIWQDQLSVCEAQKVECSLVAPYQKVTWTKMVRNGDGTVKGVRLSAYKNMSGWLLAGEDYIADDSESLEVAACGEVLLQRQDLGPYLGLPVGFRFRTNGKVAIWFDQDAAEQPIE